ncbi:hypothetical protein [Lentzea aerocolonigenes]|uniref:hypothetical protein n=1 Tax=Lentzea aerocolonigenes TaxID=68170 RepID=UPI0006960A69|nr:hypothetical protein [Lentzea aerocolonigenes]
MSLPRWNDPSLSLGSMARAALWLATVVGEGNKFSKRDLRDAFPGVAQIDRRMRDLRDYEWTIDTIREDSTLTYEEFRLVHIGVHVWSPKERRAAKPPNVDVARSRTLFTVKTPSNPDTVREQVAALAHDDKVLVLAWLVKGRRDHTPAERAFQAAQALPPEARQALMAQLADDLVGQIKETRPMTD